MHFGNREHRSGEASWGGSTRCDWPKLPLPLTVSKPKITSSGRGVDQVCRERHVRRTYARSVWRSRMSKFAVAAAVTFILAGCSSGVGTPTRLAKGANGGIWTSRPASEVQACINQIAPSTSVGTRYEVTENDTSKTVYPTTVSVFNADSESNSTTVKVVESCTIPRN